MIFESKYLSGGGVKALFSGEVTILVVKQFISREVCHLLAGKTLENGFVGYSNAPSIGRIGQAFYETEREKTLVEDYFVSAQQNIHAFRELCQPYQSPIDVLRCALDEVWQHGTNLASLYGRKMFVGLSREVKPNTTFLAHHDIFAKDAPNTEEAQSLLSQVAANVYLSVPQVGGELCVWESEIGPNEFDEMRGQSYGVEPCILGKPNFVVRPDVGDLILFNSKKMHAVAPSENETRLSVSCFVGYRGQDKSLTVWS